MFLFSTLAIKHSVRPVRCVHFVSGEKISTTCTGTNSGSDRGVLDILFSTNRDSRLKRRQRWPIQKPSCLEIVLLAPACPHTQVPGSRDQPDSLSLKKKTLNCGGFIIISWSPPHFARPGIRGMNDIMEFSAASDSSSSSAIRQPKAEQHPQQLQQPQPSVVAVVETTYLASNDNHIERSVPSPCPPNRCSSSHILVDDDLTNDILVDDGLTNGSFNDDSFTNNMSMKSELENIVFLDHCHDSRDTDDNYLPENINYESLISRIRAIRGSSQIQYRVPRKRTSESTRKPKSVGDMEVDDFDDQAELSDEIVTINRQKRVKKLPTRSRVSPYDKHLRKSSKKTRSDDSKRVSPVNPTETPKLPETTTWPRHKISDISSYARISTMNIPFWLSVWTTFFLRQELSANKLQREDYTLLDTFSFFSYVGRIRGGRIWRNEEGTLFIFFPFNMFFWSWSLFHYGLDGHGLRVFGVMRGFSGDRANKQNQDFPWA